MAGKDKRLGPRTRRTMVRDDDAAAAAPPNALYTMPGHLIRRMHQASHAIFDGEMAVAGLDLTPVQFAALTTIATRPGLDQATLAAAIAFDRATTGGVVDRLEAKGLVRRELDSQDRRARRLYLEATGKAVLERAMPVVTRIQGVMLQGLSAAESKSLLALLVKALNAVGDVSRPTARALSPAMRKRG